MPDHRILWSDPSYERVKAQREARGARFIAKLAFWAGAASLIAGAAGDSGPLVVLGVAAGCVWAFHALKAKYLACKYAE